MAIQNFGMEPKVEYAMLPNYHSQISHVHVPWPDLRLEHALIIYR